MRSQEQDYDVEMMAIRKALIEGEASGEPKKLDIAAFKRRMLSRLDTHAFDEPSTSTGEDVQRTLRHT